MKASKTFLTFILAALIVLQTALPTVMGAFEIFEYETCYDYRTDTLEPKGKGTAFFTHNEKVGFWVNISDPSTDLSMRMLWKDPNENTYKNRAVDVVQLEGAEWGIVFNSIYIDGITDANKQGVWTVELSIDGTVEEAKQFQILDYDKITSDFLTLSNQINTLKDEINDLQAQNLEIEQSYNNLLEDYNDMLENPPNSEAMEELQDQYDEMYRNYLQMQANLGTTKMMMYGAVVVAIASVAVAVYFGAIKRS